MENTIKVEGQIVDIHNREIFSGQITITDGVITDIIRAEVTNSAGYIMPGFIDSHIHIESSMLTPEIFGHEAIKHGTVAVVSDPHEIANVLGMKGIEFMQQSAEGSPIKSFFTIPSCVPATEHDRAGGEITPEDVEKMSRSGEFVALSEMMDIGGVLSSKESVISKIETALRNGLPVDGHAPLLSGEVLQSYADWGITTDHESSNLEEALEKISQEMKILIREGSACRNYEALKSLVATHPTEVMFCSDDLHADDLLRRGHIDHVVRRAIADGFDIFDVLNIASTNPIEHYDLNVGTLQIGDTADFIIVDNLSDFNTLQSYIDGELKYDCSIPNNAEEETEEEGKKPLNNFRHRRISLSSLRREVATPQTVIEIIPNEIITNKYIYTPTQNHDNLESDIPNDILKIVYINRYNDGTPQVAYCKGMGLKRGALATTIAHDSHNIIAIGCSDIELSVAINNLISNRGGMSVCDGANVHSLALPIGGIMSDRPAQEVAQKYEQLCNVVKDLGSPLNAPFMTLSFMSLCVIPTVKIGEGGVFDTDVQGWI